MLFSFSCSLPGQTLPKVCGPPEARENSRSHHNALSNPCILSLNELASLEYSYGSIPKTWVSGWSPNPHQCDGDLSLRNGSQDLGDCQTVPIMGRNGWQEAGISLHVIRFIYKEHARVLSRVCGENTQAAAPLLTNPSLSFQQEMCLKEFALPWQCLLSSSFSLAC